MLNDAERERMTIEVYERALEMARKMAGKDLERIERFHDVATDAILVALKRYEPAKGKWKSFCLSVVYKHVVRAGSRLKKKRANRPQTLLLGLTDEGQFAEPVASHLPACGECPITPELADLPKGARDAVTLYYLEGLPQHEVAISMGIPKVVVQELLVMAAEMLGADGVEPPARPRGTKRLSRGLIETKYRGAKVEAATA